MSLQAQPNPTPKMSFLARWGISIRSFGYWLSEIRSIGSIFLATMIFVLGIRIVFDLSAVTFHSSPENGGAQMQDFAYLSDAFLNIPIISFWAAWRLPILLGAGVILPLIFFIFHWSNRAITSLMQPYFLLVGAQFATLTFANAMIGQGAATFVGLFYSVLRILQIYGLIGKAQVCGSRARANIYSGHLASPCFLWMLRGELMLWLFNAAFLFLFIRLVVAGLSTVGLGVRTGE